ncbi:MAG TPA: SAM-dependent methyltransferase [Vicinamibacterales bacterium]|jgi:methyltransferase (TIGR00027 family)|nr:SAM-dependent methyltransferase [Vicinamibacterales bacterium]
MSDPGGLRNISDTAAWVAIYRAIESERPDALFRDPLARRLAGERGEQIAKNMAFANKNAWSFVARTVVVDRHVAESVRQGANMVVNLAAGLDTRPYRMTLPISLQWIEVDLPEMLKYKADALIGERPACALERIPCDLADSSARRDLFERLGARAKSVFVITEGLLVYLTEDEVIAFADDLAQQRSFTWWVVDMVSPRLLRMLQAGMGSQLGEAGAPLKFAPEKGPGFFAQHGWKPVEAHSLLHEAARLKRLPLLRRPLAWLPDTRGTKPNQPWGGVCLLARSTA